MKLILNKIFKKKSLNNLIWLSSDKFLRSGILFILTVFVAQYLGPEKFGTLNYILSIISIFYIFSALGLEPIIVKKIVESKKKKNFILSTSLILRIFSSFICYSLLFLILNLLNFNQELLNYTLIIGLTLFLKSTEVFFSYFHAKLISKMIIISQFIGLFFLVTFQIILLINKSALIYFFWSYLLEVLIVSILIVIFYCKKNSLHNFFVFKFNLAKNLVLKSWPILFSGIGIIVYMRIDQIMLGTMISQKSVGIYSAAVRISEIWHFIPKIILISITPYLINFYNKDIKKFKFEIIKFIKLNILISLVISLLIFLFSETIVSLLFGQNYVDSVQIIKIHIWSTIFVSIGVITSQWYILSNNQMYSFIYIFLGAVINIILNFYLIPAFGVNGAAIATLLSYGLVTIFFDLLSFKTRKLFKIKIMVLKKLL